MKFYRKALNNLALCAVGILISTSVLANTNFKSRVSYLNQNGCRVFDMVVDPNCPYDLAPRTCEVTKNGLQKIVKENPSLTLKSSCSRFHTGDTAKRILIEALMHSSSFDGYSIKMTLKPQPRGMPLKVESTLSDEVTCSLAADALKSFDNKGLRVTANCNGEKLVAQLQF
jgi:hypothetical protein